MRNSIGSLAALAAFAAPAFAAPLPVAADFNHVAVSLTDNTQINFDIDGDEVDDFFVYGNFGSGLRVGVLGDTLRSSSPLNYGDIFGSSSGTTASSVVISPDQSVYFGFSFITGETTPATHYAWVLFDTDSDAPMVVGGGWAASPGGSAYVGEPSPIPEPASFATLAGAAMLTGALVRRRRRATPPAASA